MEIFAHFLRFLVILRLRLRCPLKSLVDFTMIIFDEGDFLWAYRLLDVANGRRGSRVV